MVWTPPAGGRMSKINRKSAATLREPAELVAHGLAPAADLPDLEKVAARYAVAVTPDIAALIDPDDPDDPIARQFIPSAEELVSAARRECRSDRRSRAFAGRRHRASLSRPGAVQAGSRLRGVLPVLLSPRNGRAGQGDRAVAGRLRRRARLYPRASGNLGSDPDRRRSLDAVAAAARRDHGGSGRHRSRQDHPDSHPRAGRRSRAHQRRDDRGAEGRGRDDLGRAARQSCQGIDRQGPRRLRRHDRCRHSDGQPVGAAARRQ